MRTTRLHRLATVALLASAAAACDNTTGPEFGTTFDSQAALQDYQAVDGVLSSKGWRGFLALGPRVALQGSSAETTLALGMVQHLRRVADDQDARAFARELIDVVEQAGPRTERGAAPIISGLNRGKTFVYDPGTDQYVEDPARTDAPPTGVRFIVYEESSPGQPDPEQEIGYADLVDEGDGSAEDVVLRLVVVVESVTVLDYRTSVDDNGGRAAVTVDGFLRGAEDRLDFDIDVSGSEGGGESAVDIQFEMRIDSRDFAITGSVAGTNGDDETGDIDITVRHGAQSVRVDVEGTASSIAGTFYLNGDVFATVSGDPDSPTFLSASGEALKPGEVAVLLRMLAVVADVFQLFENLVEPVGHLVVLGLIL